MLDPRGVRRPTHIFKADILVGEVGRLVRRVDVLDRDGVVGNRHAQFVGRLKDLQQIRRDIDIVRNLTADIDAGMTDFRAAAVGAVPSAQGSSCQESR